VVLKGCKSNEQNVVKIYSIFCSMLFRSFKCCIENVFKRNFQSDVDLSQKSAQLISFLWQLYDIAVRFAIFLYSIKVFIKKQRLLKFYFDIFKIKGIFPKKRGQFSNSAQVACLDRRSTYI